MKLVRFGAPGREKPGIIDDKGRIRDLSKVVPDINGESISPASLKKIAKADCQSCLPSRPARGSGPASAARATSSRSG